MENGPLSLRHGAAVGWRWRSGLSMEGSCECVE